MKVETVLYAFIAIAIASAAESDDAENKLAIESTDKSLTSFIHPSDDLYVYRYESENGTTREEYRKLKPVMNSDEIPHTVVDVKGTYRATNKVGEPEDVKYWTDDGVYHTERPAVVTDE